MSAEYIFYIQGLKNKQQATCINLKESADCSCENEIFFTVDCVYFRTGFSKMLHNLLYTLNVVMLS